jgi:SAM-dependent methyltransferase
LRYISDWSPVPLVRYEQAQQAERKYWSTRDRRILELSAKEYFYSGYYEWKEHRDLLNPFRVRPSRPQNFQIAPDDMEGSAVLDVGCGPTSASISLVHCAEVHVVDPLVDFHREVQPFGWEYFNSVSSGGAEELAFASESFHFVYCWNVLDHVQDADRILREITRVLVPSGELLLGAHVRSERGGGPPHPYKWNLETFEQRVLADFTLVRPAVVLDDRGLPVSQDAAHSQQLLWVGSLRKGGAHG